MDTNNNKTLSIDEFFEVVEVIESHDAFAIPLIRRRQFWKKFREKLNQKFHFNKIASSFQYNLIIFFLMISNCAILVAAQFSSLDPQIIVIFYFIDEILLYIYFIDFTIKILGFGFEEFFSDIWNKFDFAMLLVSFVSELYLLANPAISNFSLDISNQNLSKSIKV